MGKSKETTKTTNQKNNEIRYNYRDRSRLCLDCRSSAQRRWRQRWKWRRRWTRRSWRPWGRIPRRFRDSDGALVGCKVFEDSDRPIGGGFMHQEEGEAAYVRTCWKDLDFWDGFDDAEFDPRTIDIAVYNSTDVSNCMDATTVHTAIGSFDARDSGKGRYFNPEQADVMLTGDNSVVGHYLSIAVEDEIIQCCRL